MRTGLLTSKRKLWLFVIVLTCLFFSVATAAAQTNPNPNPSNKAPRPAETNPNPMDSQKSSPSDDGSPLTTFEEEMRAKRMIKLAEKEHQQNIERAREISDIAKALEKNFKSTSTFDREGLKRLDRLEKLTKKIRGEAGGEADEVQIVDSPTNQGAAITQIVKKAESLSKAVQDTPRQVVSAGVIDSANVLLELIRILRTFSQ